MKSALWDWKPGDELLVILPIPSHPLRAGPYVVERKVNEADFVVYMPESYKQRRLCHINMLKKYYVDCSTPSASHMSLTVAITSNIAHGERAAQDGEGPIDEGFISVIVILRNSDVLAWTRSFLI